MSKYKKNRNKIKVSTTQKNNTKNLKGSSNPKQKSYLTILYTPMGLAIGLAYGFIANDPIGGILGGLMLGGGIDFFITRYKKKHTL